MSRLFVSLALTLAPAASALAPTSLVPVTVKTDWQQPDTFFLGFTDTGDLVTRRGNGNTLKVLDVGESNLPMLTPDGKRLVWQSRGGELLGGSITP